MNDFKLNLNWVRQVILVLFACGVIFFHLIPFTLAPTMRPAPDIVFCVICALLIRRPEIVPFWIIGLIYFGFDLFLMKPLGVWTACMLGATEIWRANMYFFRENRFPVEWFSVSVLFLFTLIANHIILAVSIVATPAFTTLLWEYIFTTLSYPIVLFIITYILRIGKPALGEFGLKGQRL